MVYKFFNKKALGTGFKSENISKKELARELHKPIIRKLEKRKLHSQSLFINDIWDADLTDMKLISKFSKRICPSLCVIDIFSKYAWAIPLKDK